MEIKDVIAQQKAFFNTNATKDVSFRLAQLKKLKQALKENEALFYEAIYQDFGKSEFETYVSELSLIYHEINLCLKHLKKWSKKKRVPTDLANFPARSYIIPEPLGTTLIIGAWNYPYQLSLVPAIAALAAGNTVILKPSELPFKTSAAMAQLINQHFDTAYFCVVEGGVAETTELLSHPYGKIFFTGSTAVGKIVYQAAAKHLTPVALELGGKSPAVVTADADLKMTARRLVWSKFLNAGQTCVAPDYILVEQSIEEKLLQALKSEIEANYSGLDQALISNYVQVVNSRNFDRLLQLIDQSKVYVGGESDPKKRIIYPTVMRDVSFEDPIMQDEIFGPILPVIPFSSIEEAISKVKELPQPLSAYIYSKNRRTIKKWLSEVSFGGGAINDSVMHFTNSHLPFGGVGLSGMGNYHGKAGFDTFSHHKSILDKPFWLETNVKYAPHSKKKLGWIRRLVE